MVNTRASDGRVLRWLEEMVVRTQWSLRQKHKKHSDFVSDLRPTFSSFALVLESELSHSALADNGFFETTATIRAKTPLR